MSPLHYQTRRLLCRAAFFALCALPTAGVLAWGVSRRLPGHAHFYCRSLESEVGLAARADTVLHPRPQVVVIEGLSVADPETGATLLRCPRIELCDAGNTRHITAVQPQIEAAAMPRLRVALERWLAERNSALRSHDLVLVAERATLAGRDEPLHLRRIEARVGTTEPGPQVAAELGLAGGEHQPPVRLTVTRDRRSAELAAGRGASPATVWELDTSDAWLPCRPARPLAPWVERLGPQAQFRGVVWLRQGRDEDRLTCSGDLASVDLRRLVAAPSNLDVYAQARITLEQLDVRQGRLIEIAGAVDAGPGAVRRLDAQAVADALGLRWRRGGSALPDPLPFGRLACRFRLNARGLWLEGAGPAGAVLLDDGPSPLLDGPVRQPIAPLALVPILAPGGEAFVPASRASAEVLSWLPLEAPEARHRR